MDLSNAAATVASEKKQRMKPGSKCSSPIIAGSEL